MSGFAIPYIYIFENGLLLRNILKCIVNLRGFVYNKGMATFWLTDFLLPKCCHTDNYNFYTTCYFLAFPLYGCHI